MLGQHFLKGLRHRVAPEEVVVESSVRVDPGRWVEGEESVEQVDRPLVLHVRLQPLLHPPLLDLWHLHLAVQVQLLHPGPHLRADGTAQLGDQGELVLLRVALHNRTSRPHLGHDTAGAPHVHRRSVVPLSKEEFRRTIPEGDDTVGVPVRSPVLVRRQREGTSQAEISKLEDPGLGYQNVGRLHVAVEDLLAVDEVEPVEELLHHLLDLAEVELDVGVAQQAGQVVLGKVKDQVEGRLVPIVLARLGFQLNMFSLVDIFFLILKTFVLQISMRLTMFSCRSSCKILISLKIIALKKVSFRHSIIENDKRT